MSIYPKNICYGENLIIHLRFSNRSKKIQKVKYILSILNPSCQEIYHKEEKISLGIDKKEYVKQLYHSFYINKNICPGKYIVNFYMICNGKKIESETKDNDYFYVDKLEYYISKNATIIINDSPEKTKFKLYSNNQVDELFIEGKQKLKLDKIYDYIEYANNNVNKIEIRNEVK